METKLKSHLSTHISNIILLSLLASALLALTSCNKVDFAPQPSPGVTTSGGAPICYPFGGGVKGQGLVGNITYLTGSQLQNPFTNVASYINSAGGQVPNQVLLSGLNIPIEYFSNGFADSNGSTIKSATGSPLVEYFGIHAISYFVPGVGGPQPMSGNYQVAVLSDDGSIVTIKGAAQSGGDLVINNDGTHSAQLGCTSDYMTINSSSKFQFTVDYYQGPANTIALTLLYRPLPSGNTLDQECNVPHQDTYFADDTGYPNPPVQQQTYTNLLARGWTVVDGSHYSIQGLTSICQ